MSNPRVEVIARSGRATSPSKGVGSEPKSWAEVDRALRAGEATCWLSAPTEDGVHTRPVFAAWTGEVFVVATNPTAVKTRHLERGGRCSLALGLAGAHVVIEAQPRRLTSLPDLGQAVVAFQEVYQWPTEVIGDALDAPYAAPTSGGPPFRVYALIPVRAHAFPTEDDFQPTRFVF